MTTLKISRIFNTWAGRNAHNEKGKKMNTNTRTILNHLNQNLICKTDNQLADGSPNWNWLDADIHMDVADGILDAELIGEDIDAAFDVINANWSK